MKRHYVLDVNAYRNLVTGHPVEEVEATVDALRAAGESRGEHGGTGSEGFRRGERQ